MDPTWAATLSRRLDRHHLTEPATSAGGRRRRHLRGARADPHRRGAVDRAAAGRRHRDDVRAALWETRELVKTFGPRGTVHLLPTRDLPRWTGALAAVPRPLPSFDPSVRLAPAQLDEGGGRDRRGAGGRRADDRRARRRARGRVGAWAVERCMPAFQDLWPRWRQAVDTAANRGVLCFGPDRDRKVTYTSPRRWSPGFVPAPGPEAVTWLARSYLHSYGPARPEHVAQWLSVPKPWAVTLFETLTAAGEIEPVGEAGLGGGRGHGVPARAPRGLRLLPYFDAYVGGLPPARSRLPPARRRSWALARRQAGNYPVLLVDGVVAGVWHQKQAGRYVDVTVEPLVELSAARRRYLDARSSGSARSPAGPRVSGSARWSVGPHA
jgi:hypothetical protein